MTFPKVYVILLNYQNWQDTEECLRSLETLDYDHLEVVLVDNCSPNKSLDILRNISFRLPIHFIQSEENGGFAKGNNLGLHVALARNDAAYYWLLNNDTTVDERALFELVNVAEADKAEGQKVGIYGSKLRYYAHPELLQAVGASYNHWFAYVKETGNMEVDKGQYDHLKEVDFLPGASFMVSDVFVREVGLMGEEYFLYFEELDWAVRARRAGWATRLVPQSLVYHKHGASVKASGLHKKEKSRISEFYFARNKLLFTSRYFPYCLPTVYLSFFVTMAKRIKSGQWDRIGMFVRILLWLEKDCVAKK
jgi:GT2 family glycosyltransferase